MSVPRYESYRDSGVDWLGEVPSHWEVGALKRQFEVCLGKMLQSEAKGPTDELRPYLRAANIQWKVTDVSDVREMWVSSSEAEALALLPGDLLVSEGGDVGRSAIWRGEIAACAFQNSVNRVRSLGNGDTRFLLFWMSMLKSKGFIDVICNKATIAHFTAEKVASVQVAFPPSTEQAAIAAFLDRETGKIDALVEAQRRLIELLKEKRQAVISHAVTKGLDPTAPMKHSGLDLLGEVPAHWEVIQAGRIITEIEQGWSPSAHEREPDDGEPSVLRLSAVKDGRFFPHQRKALPDLTEAELAAARTVSDGDFLLTRANTPDLVGDCAIASSVAKTIFSDLIYRLSFDPRRATPPFLTLAFRSQPMRAQVKRDARGSSMSMAKISHAHIKSWWLALPPVEEQEAILSEAAVETQKLDDGMQMAEEAITLLQERRAALISAAVTGKIDVRGVVAEQAEAA